jgi:hypothetical protein
MVAVVEPVAELAMHTLAAAAAWAPVAGSCKFELGGVACKRDSFVGFDWTKNVDDKNDE